MKDYRVHINVKATVAYDVRAKSSAEAKILGRKAFSLDPIRVRALKGFLLNEGKVEYVDELVVLLTRY